VAFDGDGGSLGMGIGRTSSVKGSDVDLVGVDTFLESNVQLVLNPGSVGVLSPLFSLGNIPLVSGSSVVGVRLLGVVTGIVGSLVTVSPDSLGMSLLFKAVSEPVLDSSEGMSSSSDDRAGVSVAAESMALVVGSDLQSVHGQFVEPHDVASVLVGKGHSVDADLVGSDSFGVLLSPANESSVESHVEDVSGSSSVFSVEVSLSSSEPVGDESQLLCHESFAGSFSFCEGIHSIEEGQVIEGSTSSSRGKEGGEVLEFLGGDQGEKGHSGSRLDEHGLSSIN